jgi:hypothetical protein
MAGAVGLLAYSFHKKKITTGGTATKANMNG